MKRICLFLCCVLMLCAVGCGAEESAPTPTPSTSVVTTTASTTTTASQVDSDGDTTTVTTTVTASPITTTHSATTSVATTASKTTTTTTTAATTTTSVVREVTVTIPEGYSFMQIARLLEQKGVCSAADFYNVCQTYTPQSFSIPISDDRCFRMEGYLFPDTYRFYLNDNPRNVLVRMLNNFRAKVGDISDETLILASIIEREARSDTHMKLVSSVFHNRLNNRSEFLYLNADPTRDYVNKYITDNPLVSNQSKYAPLYNTCGKRIGLPVGPICCPGLQAIRAAQNPAESPYYYFFYGKDYDNHYSVTLEEHEQKMAEIGVCLE